MQRVAAIRSLVPAFREAINALKANPYGNLQILRSFPARDGVSKSTGVVAKRKTVCILDSSYNPPTKAHMHLAIQALQKYTIPSKDGSKLPEATVSNPATPSLLLLFGIANADKGEAPASFEHRIAMMCLLAEEIRDVYKRETGEEYQLPEIDVGITRHAFFVDKSLDLQTHRLYNDDATRQAWVLGYDTLIRLLNPKYYPNGDLTPVYETLLAGQSRLLTFMRPGDEFGNVDVQKIYLETVDERVAERLDLISADEKRTEGVSSTKVRAGAGLGVSSRNSNYGDWKSMVCESIGEYIQEERLYT